MIGIVREFSPHTMCLVSHVMCYLNHVMCHMTHVTCQMSKKNMFKFPNHCAGGALGDFHGSGGILLGAPKVLLIVQDLFHKRFDDWLKVCYNTFEINLLDMPGEAYKGPLKGTPGLQILIRDHFPIVS